MDVNVDFVQVTIMVENSIESIREDMRQALVIKVDGNMLGVKKLEVRIVKDDLISSGGLCLESRHLCKGGLG